MNQPWAGQDQLLRTLLAFHRNAERVETNLMKLLGKSTFYLQAKLQQNSRAI
jgi:hypothetical protein